MSEEPHDELDQQIAAPESEDAVLAAVSSLSHEVRGLGERFEAFVASAPTTSTQAPEDRDRSLRQTLDRIEARLAASQHKPGATKSAKPRFGLRLILQVVALDLLLAAAVVAGRWSVNDPYLTREDYQMSVYLWQRHGPQIKRCLFDMLDSGADTSCPLVIRADPAR